MGAKAPSGLGQKALLDFQMEVTLDGELLTQCLLDEANTAVEVLVEGIDRCASDGNHRWKLFLPLCSGVQNSQILKACKYIYLLLFGSSEEG